MARPTPPPRELTYLPLARISEDTTFRLRHPGDISSLARSIAQAGQLFPIEVRPAGDGFQPITGFRRLAALRLLFRDRVLVRVHEELADEAAALVAAADALDSRPLERDELLELRERYQAMGWTTPALEELIARAIEVAEERLEDLAAQLQGLPPPDRSVPDEDAIDDDDLPPAERKARLAAREAAAAEAHTGTTPVPTAPSAGEPAAQEAGAAHAAPPGAQQRPAPVASTPPSTNTVAAAPPAEPPGPQPIVLPRQQGEAPRELTVAELAEDTARRLSLLTQDLGALAGHWNEVPETLRTIVTDQIDYYRQLGTWLEQATGDKP